MLLLNLCTRIKRNIYYAIGNEKQIFFVNTFENSLLHNLFNEFFNLLHRK